MLDRKLLALIPFAMFAGVVSPVGKIPVPYIYTHAARYSAASAAHGGDRFPAGATLHLVANGRDSVLVPGFAATADAAISYDGRKVLFSGREKPGNRWQIWEVPVGGGTPRRVVTSSTDDVTPFYLPPDRVVFARRGRLYTAPLAGGTPAPLTFGPGNPIVNDVLRDGRVLYESAQPGAGRDLFTVYSDGSGVETYRCDHTRPRRAGRELASGDIVFETSGKLARFTSSRAVEVPLELPEGEFAGPVAELPGGDWLMSYRKSPQSTFGLYRWTPSQRRPPARLTANAFQPVIVEARTRPKIHPSGLGSREGANTLCLSVYTSKQRIPAGSVDKVRVWAQNDRGTAVALGTAPVEKDGSFFVTTPADRPVRMELLDKSGRVIAAEKGWLWYRRGEQRVCVGCHPGPERAPDNVEPQTLVRSTDPARLMLPGGSR